MPLPASPRTAPRLAAVSAATREDAVAFAEACLEATTSPGHALGAGNTESGEAWLSRIGDVAQPEGATRDRGVDPDGSRCSVTSEAPDCAVPVVWDSGGEQPDEVPVDEDGAPTVRFGVGEIAWTAQAWRRRGPAALARAGGGRSARPGAPNPHHAAPMYRAGRGSSGRAAARGEGRRDARHTAMSPLAHLANRHDGFR